MNSDVLCDVKMPNSEHPAGRFHRNAGVRAKGGRAKELQLLIDSPSELDR